MEWRSTALAKATHIISLIIAHKQNTRTAHVSRHFNYAKSCTFIFFIRIATRVAARFVRARVRVRRVRRQSGSIVGRTHTFENITQITFM